MSRSPRRAVSPVVGLVLLLVITISIGTTVGWMLQGASDDLEESGDTAGAIQSGDLGEPADEDAGDGGDDEGEGEACDEGDADGGNGDGNGNGQGKGQGNENGQGEGLDGDGNTC